MKRDLLVLVPYPEKDLAQLQAAAGDLRVVTLPETAPEGQLRQALESVPGPLEDPAPFIGITGYLDSSIQYTVRAWVKNVDYWDVYYALLEKVRQSFSQNGVEMTYNHLNVHLVGETKE